MTAFAEYDSYDGLGLAELVASGEVAPTEILEAAIARIERLNPDINAIVHRLFDEARARIEDLPDGPFRGVPFVLKDLDQPLADAPMSQGSRFYRDWCPGHNSELVNRFLRTGVVIVGKSNTPELGMMPTTEPAAHGPTRNPWNPELSAGGSSGGTGAAVGARLVPLGSGGDGGGSIRIPASCNGVFGIKPTRGRTPYGPDAAEAWNGFAVFFGLSLTVRDSAALLDAVSGPLPGDWYYLPSPSRNFLDEVEKEPGKLRIAFTKEPFLPSTVHEDCLAGLEATVAKLDDLGHEVVEARPPVDGQAFARNFLTVIAGQIASAIDSAEAELGRKSKRRDWEDATWLVATLGRSLSAADYAGAMARLQALVRPVHEFFEKGSANGGYDLLLCPTLGAPPGPHGFLDAKGVPAIAEKLAGRLPIGRLLKMESLLNQASADTFAYLPNTPVFNVSGQPSMSVPLHWSEAGVPIGMMFSAAYGNEATLFRLAGQLERAYPWRDRRPPIS